MRAISIIYRRELGTYLRSPYGWVIASVVLLIIGLLFQGFVLGGRDMLSANVLEGFLNYASGIPLFAGVLLSFRLLSEERQTNSMVLLNTAPVRDSDIVLGKFFAALTFLAIVLALSIYMPILIKVNGKITWTHVIVGYFGMLLLGSATMAIGLFGSALTRNQLIAAVIAAAMVATLVFLYFVGAKVDSPIREVIEQLSLWWVHYHTSFERGHLNLKDIIYYVAVTYFFLLLAIKTLEAKRWQ